MYRPNLRERVFFEPNGYIEGLEDEQALKNAVAETSDPLDELIALEDEWDEYFPH